jgi:proteasome beta subunit
MTLILALSCKDGVVMASDGQVTSGLIRETTQKIKQIEGTTILWGASGTVGYIQKIEKIISRLPVEAKAEGLDAICFPLKNRILELREGALNKHRKLYGTGSDVRAEGADLILADLKESPQILHIDVDCDDERMEEFDFCASGIGHDFAHTLLKGYSIRELSLSAATALAYRVLNKTIAVGAYGLGYPIYLWKIEKDKKSRNITVHQFTRVEVDGISDVVSLWQSAESDLFRQHFP